MKFQSLNFCFLFLAFSFSYANAQQASSDSLKRHSATKAIIFSAVVPGAGQVYNKKYWKVPILYAGLGALIYSIDFNSKKYNTFKDAYIARTDTSALTTDNYPRYTADNLHSL